MTRTITAMFDSRSEAEAARDRLAASNIDTDSVRIIDQGSPESSRGGNSSRSGGQQEGFWGSLKDMFMPDEDRHAYGEGIRRGHFMLAAEVEESQADEACRILDQSNSIDFDQRQSEWRSEGWAGYQATPQTGAFGQLGGGTRDDTTSRTSGAIEEEHIPIVEEELRVGKREVERGGARVRSYVREIPVHESVNLREEHVSIERRPVNEKLRGGQMGDGDVFRDRDIEMTERSEEAVVGKETRVREEVVIRKTADERVEQIDDTVRRTEVDVDEGRSAFTGLDRDRDGDRDNDGVRDEYERTGTNRRDRDDGLL